MAQLAAEIAKALTLQLCRRSRRSSIRIQRAPLTPGSLGKRLPLHFLKFSTPSRRKCRVNHSADSAH